MAARAPDRATPLSSRFIGVTGTQPAIAAAYGRPVVQLNLDHLYGNGGGGAHCVTMQEPTR